MKDGDLHAPRTKMLTPLHTKPEGRRFPDEPPKGSKGSAQRAQVWFTQELAHKSATPCSHSLSRVNPSTNTHKACVKPKDLTYLLLVGLEVFLDVYEVSWDSSNLQMAGVRRIYIGHQVL